MDLDLVAARVLSRADSADAEALLAAALTRLPADDELRVLLTAFARRDADRVADGSDESDEAVEDSDATLRAACRLRFATA